MLLADLPVFIKCDVAHENYKRSVCATRPGFRQACIWWFCYTSGILPLCLLGNFACFFVVRWFFLQKIFQEYHQSVKQLGSSGFGPNCLQRLSADDASRQRVNKAWPKWSRDRSNQQPQLDRGKLQVLSIKVRVQRSGIDTIKYMYHTWPRIRMGKWQTHS